MVRDYLPLENYPRMGKKLRYVIGDCENRGAHSHNRHHELSLGFGGISTVLGYGVSIKGVWGCDNGFEAVGRE
jgi:hypothetical protein